MYSIGYDDIARRSPAMGRQASAGWGKAILEQNRQYRSPDCADGCCITSVQTSRYSSLTCLQLVFTSNWSNFRHDFASRGFLSVIWAFLFVIRVRGSIGNHDFSVTGPTVWILEYMARYGDSLLLNLPFWRNLKVLFREHCGALVRVV